MQPEIKSYHLYALRNWCCARYVEFESTRDDRVVGSWLNDFLVRNPNDTKAADAFLFVPCSPFIGLQIKFTDSEKRRLTATETGHLDLMRRVGFRTCAVTGWESAVEIIEDYLGTALLRHPGERHRC